MTKCKICGGEYVKRSITHRACSVECAIALSDQNKIKKKLASEKASRALFRQRKLAAKKPAKWRAEAQDAVNAWIRWRDRFDGCISCGRTDATVWNAGHFLTVGAHPELRYHESNINKQCARPCNKDKGGNLILYRQALIEKIGIDRVEWLEGPHEPQKYTVDDLIRIKTEYTKRLKEERGHA